MGDRNILSLRFNQDHGCFAACMESGVRIYNLEPLVEKAHYDMEAVGSVLSCEMLFRTNILAVIPGGSRPKIPENVLHIYDDTQKKAIIEIKFASAVKSVRLRRDKLIVVLPNRIHVFSFLHPTRELFSVETRYNPKGLCEVSPLQSSHKQVLVFPGHKLGSVQVVGLQLVLWELPLAICLVCDTGEHGLFKMHDFSTNLSKSRIWQERLGLKYTGEPFKNRRIRYADLSSTIQSYSSAPIYIQAHKNELACIAINQQGTRIATASEQGTLIRVWDTSNRNKLVELRRGTDPASIHCINFSADSDFLCCSSDKGTVHIFAIKDTNLNRRMSALPTAIRGTLGKYGDSQWALATFTVTAECACVCAFGPNNSIYALCLDGSFHKYAFSAEGICHGEAFDVFLDVDNDDDSF